MVGAMLRTQESRSLAIQRTASRSVGSQDGVTRAVRIDFSNPTPARQRRPHKEIGLSERHPNGHRALLVRNCAQKILPDPRPNREFLYSRKTPAT